MNEKPIRSSSGKIMNLIKVSTTGTPDWYILGTTEGVIIDTTPRHHTGKYLKKIQKRT